LSLFDIVYVNICHYLISCMLIFVVFQYSLKKTKQYIYVIYFNSPLFYLPYTFLYVHRVYNSGGGAHQPNQGRYRHARRCPSLEVSTGRRWRQRCNRSYHRNGIRNGTKQTADSDIREFEIRWKCLQCRGMPVINICLLSFRYNFLTIFQQLFSVAFNAWYSLFNIIIHAGNKFFRHFGSIN